MRLRERERQIERKGEKWGQLAHKIGTPARFVVVVVSVSDVFVVVAPNHKSVTVVAVWRSGIYGAFYGFGSDIIQYLYAIGDALTINLINLVSTIWNMKFNLLFG